MSKRKSAEAAGKDRKPGGSTKRARKKGAQSVISADEADISTLSEEHDKQHAESAPVLDNTETADILASLAQPESASRSSSFDPEISDMSDTSKRTRVNLSSIPFSSERIVAEPSLFRVRMLAGEVRLAYALSLA